MNMQTLIKAERRSTVFDVMFLCGLSITIFLGYFLEISTAVLILGGFLTGMRLKSLIVHHRIMTYMELVGRQAAVIEQITRMVDDGIEQQNYDTQSLVDVVKPKPTIPDRPSRKKN